jgi:hypothetical protein
MPLIAAWGEGGFAVLYRIGGRQGPVDRYAILFVLPAGYRVSAARMPRNRKWRLIGA